jgi:hypothetical protein
MGLSVGFICLSDLGPCMQMYAGMGITTGCWAAWSGDLDVQCGAQQHLYIQMLRGDCI